jgi:glyoxylase-like metal-dependent hydrolase (beta-lactamase superfamily II)
MYLIEGDTRALLIDTGIGFGNVAEQVRSLTSKPLSVINTHGQFDHVGGHSHFGEVYLHKADLETLEYSLGAEYLPRRLPEYLKELKAEIPLKEIEKVINNHERHWLHPFVGRQDFNLGGWRLETIEVPGHSPGSVCLWENRRGYLFSGDMLCSRGIILHARTSCGVDTFLNSMRILKCLGNIRVVFPGHHAVPLEASYLDDYIACAQAILENPQAGEPFTNLVGKGFLYHGKRVNLTYR